MPTPDELAAKIRELWAELADEVAALDDPPEPAPAPEPAPQPGPPTKPTGLAVAIGPDGRPDLRWDSAPAVTAWEVHDLLGAAPTLRATVTEPRSVRSALKTGQRRRYVVVAVGPGGRSIPSDPVDVPPASVDEPLPEPTPPEGGAEGKHPSDVLDLRNWTIMLPTGSQGDPDNAYIIGKSIPGTLFVRDDGGVVFRAPAGGVHSPGSKFCRTEAREMKDAKWTKAAWPSSETHWLECDLAIDASNLKARKRINGMQIHDGGDDVCQIMRHETQGLGLAHNDGKSWEPIDPGYVDGTRFTCRITTGDDRLRVAYNGEQVVDILKKGTGWYWKMGAYLQTDVPTYGENPDATGEVVIWRYELAAGRSSQ